MIPSAPLRVVVVGHAADRTGPPMHLLTLLRARSQAVAAGTASPWDLDIVLLRGGELEEELGRHGRVRVVGEAPVERDGPGAPPDEAARATAERVGALTDLTDLDVVIVNTAWSAHALDWLPPGDHALVTMIHELGAGLERALAPDRLRSLLAASDRITVGCESVRRHLIEEHGVAEALIGTVPYAANPAPAGGPSSRADIGVADGAVLVTAAGVTDRRKGPDLFVHLAAATRRRHPGHRWHFRWLGAADPAPADQARAQSDEARIGPEGEVDWAPPTPHVQAHLRLTDIFVVCSREDAFPLVALEAAAAERPIVVFTTVGTTELLADGAGVVVAYPDIDAMADAVAALATNPAAARAMGEEVAARVRAVHTPERSAAALESAVTHALAMRGQR